MVVAVTAGANGDQQIKVLFKFSDLVEDGIFYPPALRLFGSGGEEKQLWPVNGVVTGINATVSGVTKTCQQAAAQGEI